MALVCPACGREDYEIVSSLAVPPDESSDEEHLQVACCLACRARFGAAYEESRRGALDSECWNHFAISSNAEEARELENLIAACPDQSNPRCPCMVHHLLLTHGGDFRAVLALRLRAQPLSQPEASPALEPAPRPARDAPFILASVAAIWLCTAWAIYVDSSGRWFCLLIAPPMTTLSFWMLALSPRARRERSAGAIVSLIVGVAVGAYLVSRFG
jgi:hypothetical protein